MYELEYDEDDTVVAGEDDEYDRLLSFDADFEWDFDRDFECDFDWDFDWD